MRSSLQHEQAFTGSSLDIIKGMHDLFLNVLMFLLAMLPIEVMIILVMPETPSEVS